MGTNSYNPLEAGIDVQVIGDASAPRKVMEAVSEGYEAGRAL